MRKIIVVLVLLLMGCENVETTKVAENSDPSNDNKYIYQREDDEFTEDIVQGLMTKKRLHNNGIIVFNYDIQPHETDYLLKADISINEEITTIDLLTIKANKENVTLLYCSDVYILKVALTDDKTILEYSEYDVNTLIGYSIFSIAKYPKTKDLYIKKDNKILIRECEYHTTTKEITESYEYETDTLIIKVYLEVL